VVSLAIEQSHPEEPIFPQLSRDSSLSLEDARSFITTPSRSSSVRPILILFSHLLIRLQSQMQLCNHNKGASTRLISVVLLEYPLFSYFSFAV
jgi:hypothetical protein